MCTSVFLFVKVTGLASKQDVVRRAPACSNETKPTLQSVATTLGKLSLELMGNSGRRCGWLADTDETETCFALEAMSPWQFVIFCARESACKCLSRLSPRSILNLPMAHPVAQCGLIYEQGIFRQKILSPLENRGQGPVHRSKQPFPLLWAM